MGHKYYIEFGSPLNQQYPLQNGHKVSATPKEALEGYLTDYHIKSIKKVYDEYSANVRVKFQNGKYNYYYIDIVAKTKKPKKLVMSTHNKNIGLRNKGNHHITNKERNMMHIQSIIDKNWASINGIKPDNINDGTIIYHGSRNGIIGDIAPDKSRVSCDFGMGFYTGTLKEQAGLLVKDNGKAKLIYTLSLLIDKSNISVYSFEDYSEESCIIWALYIAYHRGKIEIEKYPKLKELCDNIDTYDIIKGLIADDEMGAAFNEFLADALTIDGLIYCLSKVKLGHQYVFKTERACSCLHYMEIEPLSEDDKVELTSFRNKMLNDKESIVDEAKDLYPSGKRFRQLLKEFM